MHRLASATSPYLLQHAHNPVDWYPWGEEALARAKSEDRPILLSIGYAACHWCHVMERESFEHAATAALMNAHFVNIKVDREERPDLDAIYMQAVQAMTGHGGWPMTVFLTPDGEPFYGGTYFPPADRHGMPAFRRVLMAIRDAWRENRDAVTNTTQQLRAMYAAGSARAVTAGTLDHGVLDAAVTSLARAYDGRHGGFGHAPKFPPSMVLDFLVTHWTRTGRDETITMARRSFLAMAHGGVFDQVGGGLHRYAVDERWLVPHFEKMLYDNALFARLGLHLWQATGDAEALRVTRAVLSWVTREMTDAEGGFYSSLDADSEGHEGTYYLWDAPEVAALCGTDAQVVLDYWGITASGNFEGRNIPHVASDDDAMARRHGVTREVVQQVVERARAALRTARERRARPALDDKVVAAWNGLMLRAVAEAARVLGDAGLRTLAERNGTFLRNQMVRHGRVSRSYRQGMVSGAGFLEDHAAVALAFLELHALTFDRTWLAKAMEIAEAATTHFFDPERSAFFDTPDDHETLITRPREITDNATPAGASLMAELLARLSAITGDARGLELAEASCAAVSDVMAQHPTAFGHLLAVADMALNGATELVLIGDTLSPAFEALSSAASAEFVPALVLVGGRPAPDAPLGLLRGRTAPAGGATAYLCRNSACDVPTGDPELLQRQLRALRHPSASGDASP
jgi:uncharacterized protein YyaL (SSP411 family)